MESSSVAAVWVGVICFALYVYYDFSGYSDMAIGMGWMLGFHFDENFRYRSSRAALRNSGSAGIFRWGPFSAIICCIKPIFGKAPQIRQSLSRLVLHRLLARRKLELHPVGAVLRAFHLHRNARRQKADEAHSRPLAHLYALLVIVVGFGIFKFENLTDLGLFSRALSAPTATPSSTRCPKRRFCKIYS